MLCRWLAERDVIDRRPASNDTCTLASRNTCKTQIKFQRDTPTDVLWMSVCSIESSYNTSASEGDFLMHASVRLEDGRNFWCALCKRIDWLFRRHLAWTSTSTIPASTLTGSVERELLGAVSLRRSEGSLQSGKAPSPGEVFFARLILTVSVGEGQHSRWVGRSEFGMPSNRNIKGVV